VSAFPVVDDMGRVVGLVSEAGMLAKEALAEPGVVAGLPHHKDVRQAEAVTAGALMTHQVVTVSPGDSIGQAARAAVIVWPREAVDGGAGTDVVRRKAGLGLRRRPGTAALDRGRAARPVRPGCRPRGRAAPRSGQPARGTSSAVSSGNRGTR
jgi:CBS domain-containing protein